MNRIEIIDAKDLSQAAAAARSQNAVDALEQGSVLFLPNMGFPVSDAERELFSPSVVGSSKNVGFTPSTGNFTGTTLTGEKAELLRQMLARFADTARKTLIAVAPAYESGMVQARASFRPVEIEGRPSSWRKDDTRLHVDSFPSQPTRGKRILRLFINVNPNGRGRHWKIGEPFENVAKRFLPATKRPFPGSITAMQLLRITKTRRSEYDHIMLQLHDLMKADMQYQKEVDQINHEFPAGSTWIAYADQVSHAVTRGQFQFEQTFLIPVAQLHNPDTSPLRVLERLTGRALT